MTHSSCTHSFTSGISLALLELAANPLYPAICRHQVVEADDGARKVVARASAAATGRRVSAGTVRVAQVQMLPCCQSVALYTGQPLSLPSDALQGTPRRHVLCVIPTTHPAWLQDCSSQP